MQYTVYDTVALLMVWCHVEWRLVTCPYFVLLGSESSTVEIHISSEIRDYEDVDADGESLDNSVRH